MKAKPNYLPLLLLLCSLNGCRHCEDKWPRIPVVENAKEWQAPYPIGKVFNYTNSDGDIVTFEVVEKNDVYERNPSTRSKGGVFICAEGDFTELQNIILKVKLNNNNLNDTGLSFRLNYFNALCTSFFNIANVDDNESNFIDGQDIYPRPNEGISHIYLKNISLGNKNYQNIYKCSLIYENTFKYVYYQKSVGIIGFELLNKEGKLFYLTN